MIMPSSPLFWDRDFARHHKFSIADILISNGRTFLLNYQIAGDSLLVPGRLTFGGFFPRDKKSVSREESRELMKVFRNESSAGRMLKWKLPPQYLSPEIFLAQNELSNPAAFSEIIDFNQHIDVTQWKTEKMSKGNQKKLRQSVSVGMNLKTATTDDILKCYEVLALNREAIGAQVTMTLSEVQDAVLNFPNIYQIMYLELGEKVAAMCLTVDIYPKVRYVLYWSDNLSLRNYSPVVLLCEKLVEQARKEGIQFLDLGISSSNGSLNEGLHRFKQNLGAITSLKKTIFSN